MSTRNLHAYFLLLIATIIWAAASPIIKFTLEGITPLPFLTYRFGISALVAAIVLIFGKQNLKIKTRDIPMLLLYGVFSTTFALGFLFLGLDKSTVLNLSLISLMGPLILSIAGAVFLNQHISKREKIGTSIAFVGTFLTVLEPILQSGTDIGGLEGNLLIILYMAFDIAAIIFLKKLLRFNYSPQALTSGSFIIGFLTILPIYLFFYTPQDLILTIINLPPTYHLGVLYMAIFSGTVAYGLRAKAQKTIKVEQTAIFGYLGPLFSVPLAVFWLHETITPLFIVGCAIVAIGVVSAEFKFGHK